MANFPKLAYDTAEKYRNPCMVLTDGIIGQMMEPLEFNFDFVDVDKLSPKDYILDGCKGREPRIINTLYMAPDVLEKHNWKLYKKYEKIKSEFTLFEEKNTDDADIIIIAYGTAGKDFYGCNYERTGTGDENRSSETNNIMAIPRTDYK